MAEVKNVKRQLETATNTLEHFEHKLNEMEKELPMTKERLLEAREEKRRKFNEYSTICRAYAGREPTPEKDLANNEEKEVK
jgi:septal ring factor EnvC (AmiA/AmiB activator)